MAIILKINRVNLFVSSVLFVFWYHSPNFLDTPRTILAVKSAATFTKADKTTNVDVSTLYVGSLCLSESVGYININLSYESFVSTRNLSGRLSVTECLTSI
jgi:hypothetical protein